MIKNRYKYKEYLDNFLVEKKVIWIQCFCWVMFGLSYYWDKHLLYKDDFVVIAIGMPSLIGVVCGTIRYFKENKKENINV